MVAMTTPIASNPYTILVIADEKTIGHHIERALSSADDLSADAHYASAIDAISRFRKHHFDAIILDIGMVTEDPLVSINRILRIDEHSKIIMISTLSFANVRQSMKGFERGAAEFIQTPSNFSENKSFLKFQSALCRVSRTLSIARRQEPDRPTRTRPLPSSPPTQKIILRPPSKVRPRILAIGSSTGGPAALVTVLSALPDDFPIPIIITQHMPKAFTAVLATTLSKRTSKTAVEGETGMILKPNHIYIAPGDQHMTLTGTSSHAKITLNQGPAVNYCRPSVEPMVESAVRLYGANTLLAILTGMGADGKLGAEAVVNAKGTVIAQDFETSVVWGMPRTVAELGYCSQVLPVEKIAPTIEKLTLG